MNQGSENVFPRFHPACSLHMINSMLPLMHALTGAPVFPYCNVRESDSEAVRTGSTQELAPTAPSLTAEKTGEFLRHCLFWA